MPDFEAVAHLRGPRLSDLPQHVRDVLALNLPAEEEYEVGRVSMAAFEFVPYALTGLAAAMRSPSTGARAVTEVTVPVADDTGGTDSVTRTVTLYGPGDVLGIDPGQIVRRYPAPGSTNAEETFHAHIEFDRPELPWAFSARTPGERMPAWLALVVLEESEVEWEPRQNGLQPIMSVSADRLPPLAEAWAWAHAQAAAGSTSLPARLSTAYAPVNVSRLLAARVLTQDTDYVACLVPTTDAGVRAGLGLGAGTLDPAWTGQSGQVRLPVYDRWSFRTARDGDFARLARRLQSVAAPWEIGRRTLDTRSPGDPLSDMGPQEAGRRQVIRCALFSPAPAPPDAPSDDSRWSQARTSELRAALEAPALLEGTAGSDPGDAPDLPIVGPRIYARAQRGIGTIPAGDWYAELNLAPAHRVVAGLGTRVVVKDQEPLMQAAWAQVGEIDRANRALMLAELARHLAGSVHRRLDRIDTGRLLQVTRPLAGRVHLEGMTLTVAGQTARSATPPAVLGGAGRRALRSGGPVTRALAGAERTAVTRMVASARGPRDFARSYVEVDGIRGLSATAVAGLDTAKVALALGVPQDKVSTTLDRATTTLRRSPTLASVAVNPTMWGQPDSAYQPGAVAAGRVLARVKAAIPSDPAAEEVRSRWIGGLAAGAADSGVVGTADLRDVALAMDAAVMHATPARPAGGAGPTRPTTPVLRRTTGSVTRGLGPELLRGGAVRSGPGAAGMALPRVAAAPGGPIGTSPVSLPPTAAGTTIGSVLRPELPAGGLTEALTAPTRDRLDRIRTAQGRALASWLEDAAAITTAQLRAALSTLADGAGALALAPTPARPVLDVTRDALLERLHPSRTVVDSIRGRLSLGQLTFNVVAEGTIRPIMAAPRFDRPMYQALDAYDREWLVPGLGTLPAAEMVTLLSTNDAFTEAFLVGLSDEMGRELLWRQYPTDARGTYFHRFWDPTHDELLRPIHRFGAGRLGSHVSVGPPGQSGRAVVVVRGEIVRRYPDMTVMAMHEQTDGQGRAVRTAQGNPVLPDTPDATNAAPSLFHAMLPPDVLLAGLDITVDALMSGGWWIVLAEHPQATRFQRTEPDVVDHQVRFARPPSTPADTGATVASTRLAQPVRVAFEAHDFLATH